MGNVFDNLGKKVFNIAGTTFGYVCTWIDSQSSPAQSEQRTVLFNDPNTTQKKYGFGQTFGAGQSLEFSPRGSSMEYTDDFFIGLKASVDNKGDEYVNIKELNSDSIGIDYYVKKVIKIHDGKTLLASLEIKK